jgi:ribonuclease R
MQLWMEKAQYGLSVDGHYGLGLAAYCHFTSPIRRYMDLVQQRIVRAMIKGEDEPYTREELQKIVDEVNAWRLAREEETESYFKSRAQEKMREVGLGSATELKSLPVSGFSRVLKQAIKDDKPTPDLEVVLHERMRSGQLSPFDLYFLAFHASAQWIDSKTVLAEELPDRPHLSIMILEILKAREGAKYQIQISGAFRAVVTVEMNGVTTSSTADGSNKKKAQSAAATKWIIGHMFGGNAEGTPDQPVEQFSSDENWIGRLNEWCQTHQKEVAFRYQAGGLAHQPKFKCYGTLGDLVVEAEAATKKDAKKLVAERLMRQL